MRNLKCEIIALSFHVFIHLNSLAHNIFLSSLGSRLHLQLFYPYSLFVNIHVSSNCPCFAKMPMDILFKCL